MQTKTKSIAQRKAAIAKASLDIEKLLSDHYWVGATPNYIAKSKMKKAARAAAEIMFAFHSNNPLQYLYHQDD